MYGEIYEVTQFPKILCYMYIIIIEMLYVVSFIQRKVVNRDDVLGQFQIIFEYNEARILTSHWVSVLGTNVRSEM
jgi:hypothetical protein